MVQINSEAGPALTLMAVELTGGRLPEVKFKSDRRAGIGHKQTGEKLATPLTGIAAGAARLPFKLPSAVSAASDRIGVAGQRYCHKCRGPSRRVAARRRPAVAVLEGCRVIFSAVAALALTLMALEVTVGLGRLESVKARVTLLAAFVT